MRYADLSDEDKIRLAIDFVAQNQPLPETLTSFLVEAGLYDAIANPKVIEIEYTTKSGQRPAD